MLPFRFYLITDRLGARHTAEAWLPGLAKAGLRALQIREKDLSPAACFAYSRTLQDVVSTSPNLRIFLNDRADIALSLGLAGVHLREDSVPLADHAAELRRTLQFGVSTHTLEGVLRAEAAGAAFATFGPIFDTPSKAAYGAPVGLKALENAAARTHIPLIALGGVTPDRTTSCVSAGAYGVAAISAIWNAEDPLEALAAFRDGLGGL